MRFALMIEPQQGLSYEEQLAIARRAEAAGFEALFRSDHYSSFPGPADNPTTDAWVVLAGLARETTRLRLGVLVSPVTFRLPGNLVKIVTTIDEMSGGRLEVGLGAGWNDVEHAAYGFPFPEIGERADMLEEQLEILHGLLAGPDGWSFEGTHYTIRDALIRPKPDPRPRIIVGGSGSPRSMRIAARWADEFNITSAGPEEAERYFDRLAGIVSDAGREPGALTRSVMVGVMVGADDAEVTRRRDDLMGVLGVDSGRSGWFEERRKRWIVGTPDEARAMVARFEAAGAERIMLQDFIPRDLEMIDLLGEALVRA